MSGALLTGLRVIDIAGEPLAMTGRLLAELGAQVIKLEPPGGDPLRSVEPLHPVEGVSLRFIAWNSSKTCLQYDAENAEIAGLLASANVVIETPGFPGALSLAEGAAPNAAWLKATPFGLDGPRSHWRATDLGIVAAAGNLFATGFPDRPPLRCSEPASYAHAGAEAAFAILCAVASGKPQVIDLSMQECVMIASMAGAAQYPRTGWRGTRMGAAMGRTREIWPCADGYVSFGLRGGPARAHNFDILLEQMQGQDIPCDAWQGHDWVRFNAEDLDDEELAAIEAPLADYFSRHTMTELYDLAVENKLMLAPANSAREVLASAQLRAREFFGSVTGMQGLPQRAFIRRFPNDDTRAAHGGSGDLKPSAGGDAIPGWKGNTHVTVQDGAGAWSGTRILEFGSGAAGPIAGRYFAEHGATVIKIESSSRPDFLRVMAQGGEHGLEGSSLFEALNPGKRSITLNLKQPGGRDIARQLMHWADAIIENFAPRVMKSCALDYDTMAAEKPDLVMISTCLNGQTGPHRDYPGFGGQGAALAGYNYLTGWEDREPIGPFGTITDSLSPRFAATALAAGLLYRQRTGKGVYFDVAQVETAVYSLSPWLLEYAAVGNNRGRQGNHNDRAVPHGVFPCAGDERWIAIACWTDEQWQCLADLAGISTRADTVAERLQAREDIETQLAHWTSRQDSETLATKLQQLGVEAVPAADFADLAERDPQLAWREHFVTLQRPLTGEFRYERNGFRLSRSSSTLATPAPMLGEHSDAILTDVLGLTGQDISALRADGSIE